MDWYRFLAALPYLSAFGVSAVVGVYALRRHSLPGARSFAVVALAEAVWVGAYLCQVFSSSLNSAYFWNSVQFSGVLLAALGFANFAKSYTGASGPLRSGAEQSLTLIGVLGMLLIWSDPLTHFLRVEVRMVGSNLVFSDGSLFFLFGLCACAAIVYGVLLLSASLFAGPRIYRLQVGTVLLGLSFPWVVSVLTWTRVIAVSFHMLTPLAFIPGNLVMFWALFRYHLFEVTPIARYTLVERMHDGVVVFDAHCRMIDFNPAAREILGLSDLSSTGSVIGSEQPALRAFIGQMLENPRARAEVSLVVQGGSAHFELESIPLRDGFNSLMGYLVVLRNVTEQKRSQQELFQMAYSDFLTGALNRRAFFELAGSEFERSGRYRHFLGIILWDVDNFKKVNDTYGHLVGDEVLKTLTQACQGGLRSFDQLARYGGEEFIVMLPETAPENALAIAQRLRQLVEALRVPSPLGAVQVTISLGVAVYDPADPVATLDVLLGQADRALYVSKQAGRNQASLFTPENFKV